MEVTRLLRPAVVRSSTTLSAASTLLLRRPRGYINTAHLTITIKCCLRSCLVSSSFLSFSHLFLSILGSPCFVCHLTIACQLHRCWSPLSFVNQFASSFSRLLCLTAAFIFKLVVRPSIAMECLSFQLPEISISYASSTNTPSAEPFSPFSGTQLLCVENQDSYRPSLLSPPAMHPPKVSSPLRPVDGNAIQKGIDQSRFQALLAATKERNATSTGRKSADLRKEIALKTHKSKQSAFTSPFHRLLFIHSNLDFMYKWSVVPSFSPRSRRLHRLQLPLHRRRHQSRLRSSTTRCHPQDSSRHLLCTSP